MLYSASDEGTGTTRLLRHEPFALLGGLLARDQHHGLSQGESAIQYGHGS